MSFENITSVNVSVQLASNVPGALANRFCAWETSSADEREVITLVPGANGAVAAGILAMDIDTTAADGFYVSTLVQPGAGIAQVLLGEAVTTGAALRAGGDSTEVDGAAYLANATSDVIIAYAMEAGSAGEIVSIAFTGYQGVVPA
jgi:hypothetical protein